ncbi:MAG: glycosyltransferase [Chthoniobacterales bacterium]|nr:glycosyltransferase [Chthoniobacterales bacterium]
MLPKLSVCILAKDAEAEIGAAIRSVNDLPTDIEIIVADDTHSTDDTSKIAASLGARVITVLWQNDFAAARNLMLDAARGEWIFWLDTDEALHPESEAELLSCIETTDALAFTVLRQDLIDADRVELFTLTTALKLLRRRPEIRYAGRIHERPDPSVYQLACALGMRVVESSIAVQHWGYIASHQVEKHRRNVALLELELSERPGQLYQQIEFGRTLLLLGDERGHAVLLKAAETLRNHLHEPAPPTPLAALLLEYLLQKPGVAGISSADAEAATMRWFPSSPPLLWFIARRQFADGDFEAAAALLDRLVYLGETGAYDATGSFDPHILGGDARLNLAVTYLRLGRLDDAEKLLIPLTTQPRSAAAAVSNLKVVASLRNRFSLPQG